VISKVIPDGYFWGQFEIYLPSGKRFLDFAIETPEGKRIAVEFDGYKSHVKDLDRKKFNDQLLRQNELVRAGWTVLRFSFDQLNDPQARTRCKEILQSVSVTDTDIEGFNKTPVLKAGCPYTECDGQVRRLRSKAGAFFWKCSKCSKTCDYDKVVPSGHRKQ
jgi:very-short-patch-repair endonuclease